MIRTVYEKAVLIDTSAAIALHDPAEQFHDDARRFFSRREEFQWAVLDSTSHECFTRVRYAGQFQTAHEHYRFLRGSGFHLLRYTEEDEGEAESTLTRFSQHSLSFHDALCAAVMKRFGIYRVFTFDSDFFKLGFEIVPGTH